MRLADLGSALSLNLALALFSMTMAILALAIVFIVLAKESHSERELPRFHPRERIRRHESTVVDFRNPSSVPDHFLQLNTLMFQKRPKNNQIQPVEIPIALAGMNRMLDDEKYAKKALPPLPIEEDVNSNQIQRLKRQDYPVESTSMSSRDFSSDGEFSDSASTQSTEAGESIRDTATPTSEGSGWLVESSTIEPLAEKIIVNLECGSEVSLC